MTKKSHKKKRKEKQSVSCSEVRLRTAVAHERAPSVHKAKWEEIGEEKDRKGKDGLPKWWIERPNCTARHSFIVLNVFRTLSLVKLEYRNYSHKATICLLRLRLNDVKKKFEMLLLMLYHIRF